MSMNRLILTILIISLLVNYYLNVLITETHPLFIIL